MARLDIERHCSECIHYEPCQDFRMFCKVLKRRITARKKPCKYYKSFINKEEYETSKSKN